MSGGCTILEIVKEKTLVIHGVGIQGAKGDQGDQGDKGDKGDKGDPGDPGVVQSVVGGTDINVDNTDPVNPIVNLDEAIRNNMEAIRYENRVMVDGGEVLGFDELVPKYSDVTDELLLMLPHGKGDGKLYNQIPKQPNPNDYDVVTSEATYIEDGIIKTAPANTPRIENGGVRVERFQSTNLTLRSEEFTDNYWDTSNCVPIANQTTAPDEKFTADKIRENSSNGGRFVRRGGVTTLAIEYTHYVFAKANENHLIGLLFFDINTSKSTSKTFNLLTGAITQIESDNGLTSVGEIKELANGWYKCSITFTAEASSNAIRDVRLYSNSGQVVYMGDGVSGWFIWGAKFATDNSSYIKTEGSQVTRLADQITTPVPAGVTEIIETINGIEQAPITVIPVTHTLPSGLINKVIMK